MFPVIEYQTSGSENGMGMTYRVSVLPLDDEFVLEHDEVAFTGRVGEER
jgi:hypothetical protein